MSETPQLPEGLPAPDWCDEKYGIALYCADCMDVLPKLPKVDAVITDPPYGIGLESHRGQEWEIAGDARGDHVGARALRYFRKTMSDSIFVVFACPEKPWGGAWAQVLVWDKGPAVGGGGDPARYWKRTIELIQVSGGQLLNGSRDEAVLKFHIAPSNSRDHPAAKPLELITYLVGKVSSSAKIIFDPFMGSGTTGVACVNLGRAFIGVEIERRYFDIAVERIRNAIIEKQDGPLFATHQPAQLDLCEGAESGGREMSGVIGIDPSYAKPIAWAAAYNAHVWSSDEVDHNSIDDFVDIFYVVAAHTNIDLCIIEGAYLAKNPKVFAGLTEVRTRIQVMAEQAGLQVHIVAPATWQAACLSQGTWRPTKHADIVRMAKVRAKGLTGQELPEDQAVAVCLADWGRCNRAEIMAEQAGKGT